MKERKLSARSLYIILIICMVYACKGKPEGAKSDYSGGQNGRYATRFLLSKFDKFTKLEIYDPWQGALNIRQTWYLVTKENFDSFVPPGEGTVLMVPVKRMVCMSATHVAMVSSLGYENAICAVSGHGLIYNPRVRELIDNGTIRDVGYDEGMNRELLVELQPDVIIGYGIGSESVAGNGKLSELGLKILYNAEYLETAPLGKAEWIKVFGALLNCSESADSLFRNIETEYNDIKERVSVSIGKDTNIRPKVLIGMPWKEVWYISPGNSYISKLIEDAGGNYLWSQSVSNISMPYNIENVYLKAAEADFWINPGTARSVADINMTDHRLALLDVVIEGNVFNNDRKMLSSGANDYWETGTVRPGLILKDLAKILTSEAFPDDSLLFYRRLK